MTASQQLLLGEGPVAAAGAYQIQRSLRFNSADSAYLNRTPASAGNQTTWTWSGWVKRAAIGSGSTQNLMHAETATTTYTVMQFSGDNLIFDVRNGGAVVGNKYTTAVYRDVSSWYHIVFVWDTTNATAADRIRVYVNGVRVTAFSTSNDPASSATSHGINGTVQHRLGAGVSFANYLNAYLTEVNFIDGQALTPSSFGETDPVTGVWKPKKYTGTYGTNGFYLNFSDNSGTTSTTLGKDYSGNGNNWTPNNFSVTAGAGNDSVVDTPTQYGTDTGLGAEVRGNYATMNAVDKNSQIALANGNLDYTNSSSNANTQARATIAYPSTGKWYFESTRGGGGSSFAAGIGTSTTSLGTQNAGIIMYNQNGQIYVDGSLNSTPGTTFASGDTMGVAVDMDAAKVYWYKNGVVINASGLSFTVGSSTWMPMIGCYTNGDTGTLNFGQRPFAYTAPSGFKALCTQNLPDPAIADGSTAFNTVTYAGDSTNGRVIQNGFRPDLVWVKNRNSAFDNILGDTLRLTSGEPTLLSSNLTNAEFANGYIGNISQWTNSSFSVNGDSRTNASGSNYIAWTWLGGNTSGSGVSNTAGSITSTVSANPTAGFAIATTTGAGGAGTIGHGLGAVPQFIMCFRRNTSADHYCYHQAIGNTNFLVLNTTAASAASSNMWNNTTPTSTVFSVGNSNNNSGDTYVHYIFAPVAGYSAFGSYTGNGSTDGPFVFTNHRPRFLLVKCSSAAGEDWIIVDAVRNEYNYVNKFLYPNLSNAEGTAASNNVVDFLSNGFKVRSTSGAWNSSSTTYVYASFCENPFKYSLAR